MGNLYVGVNTEFPIYEEQTVNINSSNIGSYFTVTNNSYYFAADSGGTTWKSNNKGVNSTTAQTTLTAKMNCFVSFDYSYSSEASYDKFTLSVGSTTVENAVSGATTSKSWSGNVTAGKVILFKYEKDSSQHKNNDECTFSNVVITTQTQTGSEWKQVAQRIKNIYVGMNGVAKKIKRLYVGVGSVARIVFSSQYKNITRSTQAPDLFEATAYMSAEATNNFALFGGGLAPGSSSGGKDSVNCYSSSLTRTLLDSLSVARGEMGSSVVGEYVLFAGGSPMGHNIGSSNNLNTVDAYNASKTHSTPSALVSERSCLRGASTKKNAFFAGGIPKNYGSSYSPYVDKYNSSLTKTYATSFNQRTFWAGYSSISDRVIFAGGAERGSNQNYGNSTVVTYDDSLTKVSLTNLTKAGLPESASNGEYVIFAFMSGGYDGGKTVDAYDSSFVKINLSDYTKNVAHSSGASTEGLAVFLGGVSTIYSGMTYYDSVFYYDTSLTRKTATALYTAASGLAATSFKNMILAGGGIASNGLLETVTSYILS